MRVSMVCKADFYYGSLLSVLINRGMAPAIFERGDSRMIYSVTIDKGEYLIYTKYASSPAKKKNGSSKLWTFSFSADEVETIKTYQDNGKEHLFCFICGEHTKMQDSEIAVLSLEQVKDCLDVGFKRDSHRITIKCEKRAHGLKAYGTGRADLLNGYDNTLRIPRDFSPLHQLA